MRAASGPNNSERRDRGPVPTAVVPGRALPYSAGLPPAVGPSGADRRCTPRSGATRVASADPVAMVASTRSPAPGRQARQSPCTRVSAPPGSSEAAIAATVSGCREARQGTTPSLGGAAARVTLPASPVWSLPSVRLTSGWCRGARRRPKRRRGRDSPGRSVSSAVDPAREQLIWRASAPPAARTSPAGGTPAPVTPPVGQDATQIPHPRQASGSSEGAVWSPPAVRADTGQTSMHAVQALSWRRVHLSSRTLTRGRSPSRAASAPSTPFTAVTPAFPRAWSARSRCRAGPRRRPRGRSGRRPLRDRCRRGAR